MANTYGRYTTLRKEVAKTANYTVVNNDNGTVFTNVGAAGAITFTLPTLSKRKRFAFRVEADFTVTVASAAGDDIVIIGDASVDSIAFSTPGEKIGGYLIFESNAAGTKWIVQVPCHNAITIAT